MNLLIVESPSKAKTIGKYLGPSFKVLSSYGHVRGLPSEQGAVDPERHFAMHYKTIQKASKHIDAIIAEAKRSDAIYLATDPDREGEAISWHILEILKEKKILKKNIPVKRAVFYEITKQAINTAIKDTRELNINLVDAQKTRQALDYLVGFNISPVLWRKLPGSKSAGRVQSVALRILCEREIEIENFKTQEYWSIHGTFAKNDGAQFATNLVQFQGEKLEKLAIADENNATLIKQKIENKLFHVASIEKKKINKNPQPPFSTSTLIQAASVKFGFSAKKTAQIAQKLYEGISIAGELVGLITYMRTDSITISSEAVQAASDLISKTYGKDYLPERPRIYKTKAKNAQEAHEAIRPTDVNLIPDQIRKFLDDDQYKLYSLIWNRLIASQMASAILDVVTVEIASDDHQDVFRASGSTLVFQGFYKVYTEQEKNGEKQTLLPPLEEKDNLTLLSCTSAQHFTQGPPRYTEASLIKKMDELGIGRPSTYPTIISILQTRQYAIIENKRFFPEARGRLVNTFLTLFFSKYVEYDFTANLENELDDIASGKIGLQEVMERFWHPFKSRTNEILEIKTAEILQQMEVLLLPYIFHNELSSGKKSLEELKSCSKCDSGTLILKNGRYGSFLACSQYPQCSHTKQIDSKQIDNPQDTGAESELPKILGIDDTTGKEISMRKGPYGLYLQRGDGKNAKRSSLAKTIDYKNIDLHYAIALLNMPRSIGLSPEGIMVKSGIGKFGPYLEYNGKYVSLRTTKLDPVTITLEAAVALIEKNNNKQPKKLADTKVRKIKAVKTKNTA